MDTEQPADRERTRLMPSQASKRPQPSYEDGHLRDARIKDLQAERNPEFSAEDMKALVRRAAPSKRPKRSK